MKKILIALLLASQLQAFSVEQDKQKHFAVGAAVSFTSANIAKYYGLSTSDSYLVGVGMSFLAGFVKEAYDSRNGGTGFDTTDLWYTHAGGLAGGVPAIIIFEW